MMDRPEDTNEPLDPWMEAQVAHAMTPPDASIPLEQMWARVAQAPRLVESVAVNRADGAPARHRPSPRWRAPALMAAGVLLGVALGRFAWPARLPNQAEQRGRAPAVDPVRVASALDTSRVPTAPVASRPTREPRAMRNRPRLTPVVAEHLQHTVAVLAAVRDGEHAAEADSATRMQLQQLLTTTRQLLDEPGARASRTHRLLEDLELVLAQLARARATAPATRAAADETLRETNLLPRLRAAAEARSGGGDR